MAEVQESGGKGKRKVGTDLNLVPFIDLMSVLITFLLITAVWTQVSMMQIGTSIYGKKTDDQPVVIPPHADVVLRLDIFRKGYVLLYGKKKYRFANKGGEYDDEGLLQQLIKVKEDYPEKMDAVIQIEDDLPYNSLINGMDVILKSGFPSISVATGGPV